MTLTICSLSLLNLCSLSQQSIIKQPKCEQTDTDTVVLLHTCLHVHCRFSGLYTQKLPRTYSGWMMCCCQVNLPSTAELHPKVSCA